MVPNPPNNPSVDVPDMLTNAQSIQSIIGTDHVSFNTTGPVGSPQGIGGQHLRVSFNGKNTPPGGTTPTDPFSTLYTNSGNASTVSQLFYNNQNGIFLVSAIRAFAYADNTGAILGSQSLNVASIVPSVGNTVFTVTLTTNAVSSANFVVLSSYQGTTLFPSYNITGTGTFQLIYTKSAGIIPAPTTIAFIVLQI